MKAYAGAIDQQLSEDMISAEISADVMSNDSVTSGKQLRSAQLYFVLIKLFAGRALDPVAKPRMTVVWRWRVLLQAYSPKNNARLVANEAGGVAFPSDTKNVASSLETTERKIKEFDRYANIEIPEFFKRESPDRRETDEDALRHEFARVDDFPGHHDRGDERQAGLECGGDKDGRRDGCDCILEGIVQREVVCWYCEKKGHRASECRKKQKAGQPKGAKKGDS